MTADRIVNNESVQQSSRESRSLLGQSLQLSRVLRGRLGELLPNSRVENGPETFLQCLQTLQALRRQYRLLSREWGKEHPQVVELKENIEEAKRIIRSLDA